MPRAWIEDWLTGDDYCVVPVLVFWNSTREADPGVSGNCYLMARWLALIEWKIMRNTGDRPKENSDFRGTIRLCLEPAVGLLSASCPRFDIPCQFWGYGPDLHGADA